jgi:hypothetical protein
VRENEENECGMLNIVWVWEKMCMAINDFCPFNLCEIR